MRSRLVTTLELDCRGDNVGAEALFEDEATALALQEGGGTGPATDREACLRASCSRRKSSALPISLPPVGGHTDAQEPLQPFHKRQAPKHLSRPAPTLQAQQRLREDVEVHLGPQV